MPDFLSAAWIEALDAQLTAAARSSPEPLTVQYVIDGGDASPVEYYLELGPDGDRAHAGRCADASVTFTMDSATARAISVGDTSSEEAFIRGDLKLDGDPTLLMDAYRAESGA